MYDTPLQMQCWSDAKFLSHEEHMKTTRKTVLLVLFVLAILSMACSAPLGMAATETPTLTSTFTALPPTSTATVVPTETSLPGPASLTGTISLDDNGPNPFTSMVQLRTADDSFTLAASTETDPNGAYLIEDLEGGTYELWVL